jgi:hypothetical protein
MLRSTVLAALALAFLIPVPGHAQWDSHWNESGPHPDSCIFNGVKSYPGDVVCVAPGMGQACELDGSLGASISAPDCNGAERPSPQITKDGGRSDAACLFDGRKFSVGAEICSGRNLKQICQNSGGLTAPSQETRCTARVFTGE